MTQQKYDVPKWILIYGSLLVVIGIGSGLLGLIAPTKFFNDFPGFANWGEIDFVTNAWGIRNVAMAIAMILVLWLRSPSAIAVIFSMRFFTELGDLINSIVTGHGIMGPSLIIFTAVWILLCSVPEALAALWGFRTAKRAQNSGVLTPT